MNINLVAVQAKMSLADYASVKAFRAKVTGLMERAMAQVEGTAPTLVAYPEAVAMYLSFVPFWWDDLKQETSLLSAVATIARKTGAGAKGEDSAEVTRAVRRALFVDHAIETERAYGEIFSSLAREHDAYVSAGSLYLPALEESPHRGGRFLQDDGRVYNTSYLFSPAGRCLRRTRKVNTPPGEPNDGAPESELLPAESALGRIATLICWDGFHETLIERCDALGARILLQPSYYSGAGPLKDLDPWSFISMIQGRENVQFGVAAFMVGAVFEDQAAEGLSYVARNTGRSDAPWQDAVVAIAGRPDAEEIVAATV